MIKHCTICNSTRGVSYKNEKIFCGKHYEQIRKYGFIFKRTIFDKNEFIDKGHFYEMIIYNRNHKEKCRCLIDKEDKPQIETLKWCAVVNNYIYNAKHDIKIHQFLMGTKPNLVIDHINGNPLDNRKINLRFATRNQNQWNSSKNKNSKHKGISYHVGKKKWIARIFYQGKSIWLGAFETPKSAALAYDKKACELFGEFARPNFNLH